MRAVYTRGCNRDCSTVGNVDIAYRCPIRLWDRGGKRFFVGEYLLIEKNKREGNIGRIRAEYNERVGAFRVSSNSAELVSTRGVSQYLTIYG